MRLKLAEVAEHVKQLNVENNFYHSSTTVFMTIKKVMETEKELLVKMGSTSNE